MREQLFITEITENFVVSAIKHLKPNITMVRDDIRTFLIKDCAFVFSVPLAANFKIILQMCTFADLLKYLKFV